MAALTRDGVWRAMGWWPPPSHSSSGGGSDLSCYGYLDVNSSTGAIKDNRSGTTNRGVIISSSSVNFSIVCLDPMPEGRLCPCCWKLPKHVSAPRWWAQDFSGCGPKFNILW